MKTYDYTDILVGIAFGLLLVGTMAHMLCLI